jgi:hypothetical protein
MQPIGAGQYTQWTTVEGAPFHWIAVSQTWTPSDTSRIRSAVTGQRDSFRVSSAFAVRPDDRLVSLVVRAWLQWFGGALSGNANTMAFYRWGGIDVDIATWSVPQADPFDPTVQGPVIQMPDLPITGLNATTLKDTTFQIGLRRTNARALACYSYQAEAVIQPFSDRATMAGHRGWTRRRAA